MGVVAALILEEVGLNVLEDGEENAARLIGCNTAARAGYALRDCGCEGHQKESDKRCDRAAYR